MASRNIKDCVPELQEAWSYAKAEWDKLHPNGPKLILTATLRTCEEQDKLYSQGRTEPGKIVTKAKCGQSAHNFGKAFDVAFVDSLNKLTWDVLNFRELAKTIKKFNSMIVWGGDWKFTDYPHFEIKNWRV